MAQLVVEGALSFTPVDFGTPEGEYLRGRAKNRRLIDLLAEGQKWVEDGGTTINALLQELNCYSGNIKGAELAKVFGTFRKDDLLEMVERDDKGPARICRSVGKWAVVGMPCWDESDLVGLWLIHPKVFDLYGYEYLRLQNADCAIGLGHLVRGTDDAAFVTNDPRVALRYSVRQLWSSGSLFASFLCPGPVGDRRVTDTGVRETIYMPCESNGQDIVSWLKLAVQTTGSQTVTTWKMTEPPLVGWPAGTARAVGNALKNLAVPAHQALGAFLLSRPLNDGVKHVATLSLSSTDQNLVRSYFGGDDLRTLDRLFDTVDRPRSIDFNGKRITETKAGWKTGDSLISSAIIRISQSETDKASGKTTIDGTVSDNGKIVRFREDLAVIKKDPVRWLDTLVRNMQGWPQITPTWGRFLLDIAYQFSKDVARLVVTDRPFGWSSDILRFPRFMVDSTGVTRTNCSVLGPNILPPEPMGPNHYDALSDRGFCMVSLALLGNLVRTQQGLHGLGLLVPGAPHVVERVAGALGLPVAKDAEVREVMSGEQRPLPLAGFWQDAKLSELLKVRGPKNIFTSVDSRAFKLLAADPTWVRLPVEALGTYAEIRWIFHALPHLMRTPAKAGDDRLYTPLAQALHPWVYPHCMKHQLIQAAAALDSVYSVSASQGSQASKLVSLLRQFHEDGLLRAETVQDTVKILHQDVLAAFASPVLPPADIARMTTVLAEGKMLVGADSTSWRLGETLWSLMGSFLRTKD